MTEVYIEITGAVASASKNGPLVAGMVGVPANFSFDDSWGGLNITVVFSGSGKKIDWPLLDERTVAIPWEVMTKPNTQLQIGAEGRLPNGTLVIPTVWATVGTLKAGAQSTGNLAQPPSPTPYDRIMSAIGDLNQLNTEAKDSLVAAINEAAQSGGDKRSAVRLTKVTLLASGWVGEASPWSQVVTIDGTTPYSLVDLQPSVEQLTIFHEKDLAFVTENEDGVLTVYAVGDKPQNDYTIQATVTEVKA